MTVDELNKRIEYLKSIADDDEMAHAVEDEIRTQVLLAIMNGAENPRELAALALTTDDIDFVRWYA